MMRGPSVRVYQPAPDWVQIVAHDDTSIAEFIICDDCRHAYLEPVYYTFEVEACIQDSGGYETPHADSEEGCTGNMCPECAGSYLDPDDPDDPRRPEE